MSNTSPIPGIRSRLSAVFSGLGLLVVLIVLGLALPVVALFGCAVAPSTLAAQNAAVAYFDATGDEYASYVTADPKLDDAEKARRLLAVDTFAKYVAQTRANRQLSRPRRSARSALRLRPDGDDDGTPPAKPPTAAKSKSIASKSLLTHAELEVRAAFADALAKIADPERLATANTAITDLATLTAESIADINTAGKKQAEAQKPLSTLATLTAMSEADARQALNTAAYRVVTMVSQTLLGALVRVPA